MSQLDRKPFSQCNLNSNHSHS